MEGNKRWTIIKTPEVMTEYEVKNRIIDNSGGVGDDVEEIISLKETNDQRYSWDYTQ